MEGRSKLGPTCFVTISTDCLLVVLAISFSLPVFTFELVPSCVPVISESSCVPNIFPIRSTPTNLLRPSFDRDVQRNPNEQLDHRRLCNAPVVTPWPLSLLEYPVRPLACFEAGCFCRTPTNEINCRCETALDSAVTLLLLDGPEYGITGAVVALLDVFLLAKRRVLHLYGAVKKWNPNAVWSVAGVHVRTR